MLTYCSKRAIDNATDASLKLWIDENIKMNQIQVLGSHNSYKEAIAPSLMKTLKEEDPDLAFELDYNHISLTEQLDLGLRKLELDIYYDPEGGRFAEPYGIKKVKKLGLPAGPEYDPDKLMLKPGFKVLHIQDIDFRSNCLTFEFALKEIKAWSENNPDHFPIIITMNTNDKIHDDPDMVKPLPFDSEAYDALDREILSILPKEKLIMPDDVRGEYDTLEEAVLAHNWLLLGEARGRIMFVLDQNDHKLETYVKDHPSLKGRILFVNAEEGRPEAAFRIVNDPIKDKEYIQELVRKGYLIRTRADAETREARNNDMSRFKAALESGAHYISTDYYMPNPAFGTGYKIQLPENMIAVWNPIITPERVVPYPIE
jgi:hypothetical protein